MSKSIHVRIDHLEGILKQEKELADEWVRGILRGIPLDVKEMALDALPIKERGEKLTPAQQAALDQLEASGYFDAVEAALPYENETEKARSSEFVERQLAGDDWREFAN